MPASQLLHSSPINLPTSSYIYAIRPVQDDGGSLAVISSDDTLRIIDPNSLQPILQWAHRRVHEGVTCLTNFDGLLATAGRDAMIRCWDPRSGSLSIEFGANAPCLSLACRGGKVSAGTQLSQAQATIAVWDHRSPRKPFAEYVESHSDDVTELQMHPTYPSRLISGATDGLVNVFDISVEDEEEALLQIINHGSSIHHVGLLSDTELCALSHDEVLSVYQLDHSGDDEISVPPRAFGDLRTRLCCEYVVDVVFTNDRTAILGAGSHSKQNLDLVPLRFASEWMIEQDHSIQLPGAHGEEIVRSICFDHSERTIFTGGEDGLVKAWRTPDVAVACNADLEDSRDAKKPKKKATQESEKARFRPY